jgi:hypothetical protein
VIFIKEDNTMRFDSFYVFFWLLIVSVLLAIFSHNEQLIVAAWVISLASIALILADDLVNEFFQKVFQKLCTPKYERRSGKIFSKLKLRKGSLRSRQKWLKQNPLRKNRLLMY